MEMIMSGKRTAQDAERELLQYDIITFDVFDTLITRCVLEPGDIFVIVEAQAKKLGIPAEHFANERVAAEQHAYHKYGENFDFGRIYGVLQEEFSYTDAQCKAMQELELETELQLAVARDDVKCIVEKLLTAGKRIVLCSDMYLSSGMIHKLLKKCGYPDGLELWVSCEKDASKKTGDMWKKLFASLPENCKVIHVGDNDQADYRSLKELGKEAMLIRSGLQLFHESELYGYLSKYISRDSGSTLLLGYLVNQACFNSPFRDSRKDESLTAIWCGGIFACFMDFLVQQQDDSQLIFVTREGFLLKPMYERYCKALGITQQGNALFYASRQATLGASLYGAEELQLAMLSRYEGTLGAFLENRLNYQLEGAQELYQKHIVLPDDSRLVMDLLKDRMPEILENSARQRDAYLRYISIVRQANRKMTVVDIGCNGTIQYGLSKVLQEKVAGIYMFLNEKTLPERMGCSCLGLRNPRTGVHPVYDNQLFLEAAMQAPCGQLKKIELENGNPVPRLGADACFSSYVPVAQEAFCKFVEWYGSWKKNLGAALSSRFELAEDIWICLLKFRFLPQELVDSFWLGDDFSGNPDWKYDSKDQVWRGTVLESSLAFCLQKDNVKPGLKYRVKNYVKAHIPYFVYTWAQKVWHKYLNAK